MPPRPATVALTTVIALSGLVIALTGCSSSSGTAEKSRPADNTTTTTSAEAAAPEPRHLASKDFAETIKQPGVIVLDVRTPAEFAQGHLAGAKNIDVQAGTFAQQIAGLDKTATYAVYCRSGHRSNTAGGIMLAAGFPKVVDLTGGITAWTAAGNQITSS